MNEQEFFSEEQPPVSLPPQPQSFLERHGIHPVAFGFVILAIMAFLYHIVGSILTVIFFGWDIPTANITALRLSQGAGQIILMLIPTFLLVRLVSFSPSEYMRLRAPNPLAIVHAIVGVFSLQQLLQVYLFFQDKIPLPEVITRLIEESHLKEKYEEAVKALVGADSISELFVVIVIVAVIPALVEELFFRGLVQRTFENILTPQRGYIFTGIVFGAFHLNPFQIVPLAALGIYLGFLANKSGSVWVSTSAHFFNNMLACLAIYFQLDEDTIVVGDPAAMPLQYILLWFMIMMIIFSVSTYLFLKATEQKQSSTPTGIIGL